MYASTCPRCSSVGRKPRSKFAIGCIHVQRPSLPIDSPPKTNKNWGRFSRHVGPKSDRFAHCPWMTIRRKSARKPKIQISQRTSPRHTIPTNATRLMRNCVGPAPTKWPRPAIGLMISLAIALRFVFRLCLLRGVKHSLSQR